MSSSSAVRAQARARLPVPELSPSSCAQNRTSRWADEATEHPLNPIEQPHTSIKSAAEGSASDGSSYHGSSGPDLTESPGPTFPDSPPMSAAEKFKHAEEADSHATAMEDKVLAAARQERKATLERLRKAAEEEQKEKVSTRAVPLLFNLPP